MNDRFSIPYSSVNYVDHLGERKTLYRPVIDLLIFHHQMCSRVLECYFDTGADFTIFPGNIARTYLGLDESEIQKGIPMKIIGVGGIEKIVYGQKCKIVHSHFQFEDTIYFLDEESHPLLGRIGFMNHFKYFTLDEVEKKLVMEFDH